MTKHPIEVITSVERRRRWPREDKERLVAACLEPGAVLSEIVRSAGTVALIQDVRRLGKSGSMVLYL